MTQQLTQQLPQRSLMSQQEGGEGVGVGVGAEGEEHVVKVPALALLRVHEWRMPKGRRAVRVGCRV